MHSRSNYYRLCDYPGSYNTCHKKEEDTYAVNVSWIPDSKTHRPPASLSMSNNDSKIFLMNYKNHTPTSTEDMGELHMQGKVIGPLSMNDFVILIHPLGVGRPPPDGCPGYGIGPEKPYKDCSDASECTEQYKEYCENLDQQTCRISGGCSWDASDHPPTCKFNKASSIHCNSNLDHTINRCFLGNYPSYVPTASWEWFCG